MQRLALQKNLGILFCILALVPWLNFGANDFDLQPWPFLAAVIFILSLKKIKIPENTLLIFLLIFFGLLLTLIFTNLFPNFLILRGIVSYFSLPLFYLAFYNFLCLFKFPLKTFVIVNIVWLIFGILDLFYPEASSFLRSNRWAESRVGSSFSLAPEPFYFAIYLLFSSWFILLSKNFKVNLKLKFLIIFNVFSIIFLAKSLALTMYIILLIIIFFIYFIFKFFFLKISKLFLLNFYFFILLILVFIFSFFTFLSDGYRISNIIQILENFNLNFIFIDESINVRVEAFVLPIFISLNKFFAPLGIDTYHIYRDEYISFFSNFFWNPVSHNKIMSWLGSIIFELGIFGIFIIFLFVKAAYSKSFISFINIFFLIAVLFSAVPILLPLIPMFFALMVYKKNAQ
jgi:hypothetical protein